MAESWTTAVLDGGRTHPPRRLQNGAQLCLCVGNRRGGVYDAMNVINAASMQMAREIEQRRKREKSKKALKETFLFLSLSSFPLSLSLCTAPTHCRLTICRRLTFFRAAVEPARRWLSLPSAAVDSLDNRSSFSPSFFLSRSFRASLRALCSLLFCVSLCAPQFVQPPACAPFIGRRFETTLADCCNALPLPLSLFSPLFFRFALHRSAVPPPPLPLFRSLLRPL